MTTTPPAWQSDYHLILLHPTEPRILLMPEQNSWRLPSFHKAKPAHMTDPHLITETVQRQLGIVANVLYCAHHRVDGENARQELMYVLEIRHPSQVPPAGSLWIDHDTLAHLEGTSKQAMRGGATYWLRILLQLFGGDDLVGCQHFI